jgi:hypothetical protein
MKIITITYVLGAHHGDVAELQRQCENGYFTPVEIVVPKLLQSEEYDEFGTKPAAVTIIEIKESVI